MTDTTRFARCLAVVLEHEGGYADHPDDPGGATKFGITRTTLARWRKVSPASRLPKAEVRALTRTEAARIYRARYWDRCRCDALPSGLDLAVFDFAVNSGPARAIRMLQALVGTKRDGIVGPDTRAAIARRAPGVLIEALCTERRKFLERLPQFATFGRGWTRRVERVRGLALADAPAHPDSSSHPPRKGQTMISLLDGYKTYAIGALMLMTGLAQTLGWDLSALGAVSGPELVMQALAVIFLRRGIKTNTGGA